MHSHYPHMCPCDHEVRYCKVCHVVYCVYCGLEFIQRYTPYYWDNTYNFTYTYPTFTAGSGNINSAIVTLGAHCSHQ